MHVIATTDPAIIDALTLGAGLPPAAVWVSLKPWTLLAAIHDGEPVAGAMVIDSGEHGLPEVHLIVPPPHGGPTTISAFALFRAWVMEHRPEWERVWAYSSDARTIAFAQAMGFVSSFHVGDFLWMFYPLKRRGAAA